MAKKKIIKFNKRRLCILALSIFLISLSVYYFYPKQKLPQDSVIDRIVVDISEHHMYVFEKDNLLKTYKVSIGRGEWGIHSQESDYITPRGTYVIDGKLKNSSFHRALTISVGGQIEIHGLANKLPFIGKFHRLIDWTKGCIALTNNEIDELYTTVPVGTKIIIKE